MRTPRTILAALAAVLFLAAPAWAQQPKIAEWAANPGAVGYELEMKLVEAVPPAVPDAAFAVKVSGIPLTPCTGSVCVMPITAPLGVARWRVVTVFAGGRKVVTDDAGFYTCVGMPECPGTARRAGVQ